MYDWPLPWGSGRRSRPMSREIVDRRDSSPPLSVSPWSDRPKSRGQSRTARGWSVGMHAMTMERWTSTASQYGRPMPGAPVCLTMKVRRRADARQTLYRRFDRPVSSIIPSFPALKEGIWGLIER